MKFILTLWVVLLATATFAFAKGSTKTLAEEVQSWGMSEIAPLKKLSDFGKPKIERTAPKELLVKTTALSKEEFWRNRTSLLKIATMAGYGRRSVVGGPRQMIASSDP